MMEQTHPIFVIHSDTEFNREIKILKAISDDIFSGSHITQKVALSNGTTMDTIRTMMLKGLITANSISATKRYYRLTFKGRKALEILEDVERLLDTSLSENASDTKEKALSP